MNRYTYTAMKEDKDARKVRDDKQCNTYRGEPCSAPTPSANKQWKNVFEKCSTNTKSMPEYQGYKKF